MDRQTATKFIQECLSQPFDEGRFKRFTNELLNHMEARSDIFPAQYIKDAFKDHVRLYKRVGKYTDPDGFKIDVLIVYLRKTTSLDRARTKQRDFVVDYLKTRGEKDAGLVAYVSDDPADWRFSLVRVDYRTVETPTGRVKIKEELTPARRFSFLVGQNEPHHTAQQQLFPILADTAHDPTLTDLEIAFSIEPVTKEFFNQYKERYLDLKEELDWIAAKDNRVRAEFERCGIDTAGFAKKLLGQIVFLYFLQKKGWLGVQPGQDWGTGSKNYLQELFQKKQYNNFFDEILEPLFYDALAVERPGSFYPRLNCRIPFLNGGLFEPFSGYDWQGTDLSIRNEVFESIFQTFNQYNFTVREDDPLEREVAVDPEMLGKVFENLLEVQDRKSKGAFYTPREIVHYMCQESLINYLDTTLNRKEHKLAPEDGLQGQLFGMHKPVQKAISIEQYTPVVPRADIETFIRKGEMAVAFDTAKEAGTTSYKWQMPESIRTHARDIDRALADIRICDPAIGSGAFPVGMMTEIVKARQVLNTYLPQDPQRTAYAFKRHAIEQSIYGVDIDSSAIDIARLRLWLSLVVDEDNFHTIQPLPNLDYKIVCGDSLTSIEKDIFNSGLFERLEELKNQYFNQTSPTEKQSIKKKIDEIVSTLTQNLSIFDYEIYFSEVFQYKGGFDVVIGNPPYISHDKIKRKDNIKEKYQSYEPFADIYCYFLEQSIRLINSYGTLCLITSNSYLRANYGLPLRRIIRKKTTLLQLISLEDSQVFDSAIVNVAIIICSKAPIFSGSKCVIVNTNASIGKKGFDSFVKENCFFYEQEFFDTKSWTLIEPELLMIQKKIEGKGISLERLGTKIRLGIATGYNEAFIIDDRQRDKLIRKNPKNGEIIKPILRGRDIQRYYYEFPNLYILLTKNGVNVKKDYPDIYDHLNSFGERFRSRGAKGQHWTNLRACSFFDDFKSEKIIWIELTDIGRFALCKDEVYLLNSAYFLIPPRQLLPEYLLGILNSLVIRFYLSVIAETSGMGTSRWINNYVKEFPIPLIPAAQQSVIKNLVEKIIEKKRIDQSADVRTIEREIDQEVYLLYGLTEEEISLVEQTLNIDDRC